MNRMLSRVDASVQRQRRLVADVSHDLQGPLTAQRVSLELALAAPGAVDTEVLRDEVLGATGEMERLVDDLLVLAAADEGAPAVTSAVDLDALVLEEAARARNAGDTVVDTAHVSGRPGPGQRQRAAAGGAKPARQRADPRRVARRAAGRGRRGRGVLDVVDDGPGVSAADAGAGLRAVPPRRPRPDPRRSRHRAGAGHRAQPCRAGRRTAGAGARRAGRALPDHPCRCCQPPERSHAATG